ncbi:MAG: PHP domain-containing protein [Chloroflexi bacterium]|nr:PHP domain-containing protein [Chloroflexota bacterium]
MFDHYGVDLHVHTSASDGQYTPSEVVGLAHQFNVIAITDHDTTDGIAEARTAAARQGMPLILAGIEISTAEDRGDVHMLGYLVDIEDAWFQESLAEFREARFRRGQQMVEKLSRLGVELKWSRVEQIATSGEKTGAVGRPHIARAMVEAGYVDTVREAFDRYIGTHAPAYVARKRLPRKNRWR